MQEGHPVLQEQVETVLYAAVNSSSARSKPFSARPTPPSAPSYTNIVDLPVSG